MHINIHTNVPAELRRAIFAAIDDGSIRTWQSASEQGSLRVLTHRSGQYADAAILRLRSDARKNILEVTTSFWDDGEEPSNAILAIYLGMFSSLLLTHFSEDIEKLELIP